MKLMWFHLMPYTELPEDFREKHPSVWVDIHSSLFDPRRAHLMYNDFMDELEFAAECGFDAVCVNEHHSNGYGLMPSPNLIASALVPAHHGYRLVRDGQLGGALQPADPGRRGICDDRLHLGRAADRRLSGRHADGHLFRLWPEPEHAARPLLRGARARDAGMDRTGYLRLQRPLQPAALREHLAAAGAEAAPADLDPGRRLGRDLAMVRADGLRLRLSLLFRLQGRPRHDGRLLGGDGPARQGRQPVSRRLPAIRRGRREPRGGDELYRSRREYFYGRCLHVDRRWAMPPGYITEATQRAGIVGQIGRAASRSARQAARSTTRMEDIVEHGYVIIGSPGEVVEQLTELATDLNVGHLMLLMQFGNMGKDLAAYNTKLFAEQVLPKLRGLFSEWEDKWWPQPMQRPERAEVPAFQASLAAQ